MPTGETSNFVVASSLFQRLNKVAETTTPFHLPSKSPTDVSQAQTGISSSPDALGLQSLLDSDDFIMPLNMPSRRYRALQKEVADRHVDNFFATIYIFFPIFDMSSFRTKYARLRALFGSNRLFASQGDSHLQPQTLCLLYTVLALGAQYADDDDNDDNSSWAAWYFSEAEELLGRLFDAVTLELVQAVMFMVRSLGRSFGTIK